MGLKSDLKLCISNIDHVKEQVDEIEALADLIISQETNEELKESAISIKKRVGLLKNRFI